MAVLVADSLLERAAGNGSLMRASNEMVRIALSGDDPLAALPEIVDHVDVGHRERYAGILAPNGAVWLCLASAVWAVRTTRYFESAVRAAVDLGGDTDIVAAGS